MSPRKHFVCKFCNGEIPPGSSRYRFCSDTCQRSAHSPGIVRSGSIWTLEQRTEVVRRVHDGESNWQIARAMGVTPSAVNGIRFREITKPFRRKEALEGPASVADLPVEIRPKKRAPWWSKGADEPMPSDVEARRVQRVEAYLKQYARREA